MKPIALTGIKPTGKPHIGNYLGMYRPALDLMKNYQGMYFVADYHALTSLHDPNQLREHVYEVLPAGWRWGSTRTMPFSSVNLTSLKSPSSPGSYPASPQKVC